VFKPAFELRARQQLALTPRLQQSVRLLQLSALEFAQELQQALATNPFLEEEEPCGTEDEVPEAEFEQGLGLREDAGMVNEVPLNGAGDAIEDFSADSSESGDSGDSALHSDTMEEYTSYDDRDTDTGSQRSHTASDGEDRDIGEWMHARPSLLEHLRLELRNYRLSERDKALARLIIDALDDDGYLRQDLAELAQLAGDDLPVEEDELRIALMLVQQIDPPGIAARSLSECLGLQLAALHPDTPARELARAIVSEHLDKLARRDFAELERLHQTDGEDIRVACKLIRSLDPRPGARFVPEHADYVVPDVLVRKIKGQWVASINPAVLPRTRVHRTYADMFQQARCNKRSPLAQQLQEARWLIRNAEQRFSTIHRVAEAIVAHQRTFFEYGEIAMKPLVLRDVAEELRLHESTVSRATGNKYMATPRGIYEFKHFFSRQLATESGGSCSAAAVRALLKEMIAAENSKAPLSDVSLARMLADQGVIVARRTVAKYRGLMKLPPAELRREVWAAPCA